MAPTVSVVLPLYNCVAYVGAAIESILAQSFADFELIVIDDGSTDETPRIAQSYRDPRLRFYPQQNAGLAATLNRGIGLAKGRYIARQDQDDLALPERLRKQAEHLDTHPACALVGTWADIWSGERPTGRAHRHPAGNAELQYALLLDNPFVHSSVMIRKDALDAVGGYSTDPARQPPEDFELWSRIARRFEVANIPEALHVYREVAGSMSRAGDSPFVNHLVTLCAENLAWAADTDPGDQHVVNIAALAHGAAARLQRPPDFDAMRKVYLRAVTRVAGKHMVEKALARMRELRSRERDLRYGQGWRRHILHAARRARQLVTR